MQEASVTALKFSDSYYRDLTAAYTAKRSLLLDALDQAGLSSSAPAGAYYVMVDVSEFGVENDAAFCQWLASEVGVAAVPGSSLFREPVHKYIRFHFAKKEDTLAEAGRRLLQAAQLCAAPEVNSSLQRA